MCIRDRYNGADIDFPTVTDSQGEKIKITHGNFVPLLSGTDRELRKKAFHALYDTYGKKMCIRDSLSIF